MDSAGDPELQPWSTVFHFETDEKRLNCIRDIKFRLKPLADKMDGFHSTLHVRDYKYMYIHIYTARAVKRPGGLDFMMVLKRSAPQRFKINHFLFSFFIDQSTGRPGSSEVPCNL